ncbi:MAG: flavin reductase [Flavobacteriaceae bacterium]|nr:flavin reductase [Flavobacteriaceae bacterium]
MRTFDKDQLQNLDKIYRLNLVNSCTGYKSANLLGTCSTDGQLNVAVFSSVTHLGSLPALLGFILRPTTVPRDTYKNIRETGHFSVNHITDKLIRPAHQSSAKYEPHESEFDKTDMEAVFMDGLPVPFVKASPVKLYCKYLNEYPIKENGTIHIIAAIEKIYVDADLLHPDGWLQLDKANVACVNGLDGYAVPKLMDRFAYARPHQEVQSLLYDTSQNTTFL